MLVTNLTSDRLGIDGVINLWPYEARREVPDTEDLLDRVSRLQKLNLVKIESGIPEELEKYTDAMAVEVVTPAVESVEPELSAVAETEEVIEAVQEIPEGKPRRKTKEKI